MKILFVIGQLGLGGAERQLLVLAKALAQAGHRISVAVFRAGGAMETDAVSSGVTIVPLGGGGAAAVMARLRAHIATSRPDVVHGYLTAGNIAALAAYGVRPRPLVVWGVRASDMKMANYGLKWRLAAGLEQKLARLPDRIIVNSHAGKAAWAELGVPDERMIVVPNGIDLDRFAPDAATREAMRARWGFPPQSVIIGHVARIDPMKDHHGFLAALGELNTLRQDWRALMVAAGSEAERELLRGRARDLGIGAQVLIQPPAPDIADVYRGLDMFCSSSVYGEGFSNVLAEALASGLPAVVTDVGDARRIVGEAGVTVPILDPHALACALNDVLLRRRQLAGRARAQISPFSVTQLAHRTSQVLEKALGALGRPAG